MTLSIKNGGYAFLIRLGLVFSMSLWRVPIITNFKQPNKHLIKLILYENYVKLSKCMRSPV